MTSCASIPEASYIEYARLLAMHPLASYHMEAASQWLMGDIRDTFYNRAMQARFEADEADRKIDEMIDRFLNRDLPMAWMVGPSSQPADLGRRLQAHGLVASGVLTGMIADLTKFLDEYPRPEGLVIQAVSDSQGLQSWVRIVAHSYNEPRSIAGLLFELYEGQGFGIHLPHRLFIGSLENGPVAAALLLMGIHSAGIYNVGTLPEARRHGYGAALTRQAMLEAKGLGYTVAALASTEMGVGIYQRLGFNECCRLEIYRLKKPKGRKSATAIDLTPGRPAHRYGD